mmetsp:Transcript_124613/g.348989  ORF Transcript_124613/g.348989 Transcript_124613/m.348989 type:complete len:212 (+) Transcript_124613:169-804(+)
MPGPHRGGLGRRLRHGRGGRLHLALREGREEFPSGRPVQGRDVQRAEPGPHPRRQLRRMGRDLLLVRLHAPVHQTARRPLERHRLRLPHRRRACGPRRMESGEPQRRDRRRPPRDHRRRLRPADAVARQDATRDGAGADGADAADGGLPEEEGRRRGLRHAGLVPVHAGERHGAVERQRQLALLEGRRHHPPRAGRGAPRRGAPGVLEAGF